MPALDRRLVRRARPVRVLLGADVALGLGTAALVLAQAVLLAHVAARAFAGAPASSLEGGLILLAVVFAARGALAWAFEALGARAAAEVLSELRLGVAEGRLRRRPAALDGVETGEVVAAAVDGVEPLEAYFARYLPQTVLACVVPLAVLCLVAAVDPTSAAVMLATLPAVPVFMWLIGRYTEQSTRRKWLALRLLSTHYLDVVRGLPTLRLFNRSRAQVDRLADVGERYRRATMETLRVSFLSGSVLELAATLGVALVAVTVGVRLVHGSLGLQAGLTVLLLAPELYLPLRSLGAQYHASADGVAVAKRLLDLLEAPPEASAAGATAPPSPAVATISFDDVSFAFPARPAPVLDRVRLELRPGETVALTGESGAGKSTVAMLLLRLADVADGRITVGGVDLASCDADLWRRHVAWLPQQPTILRGTVADNIRLGRADADDDAVRRAANGAGADRFVSALPDGYETLVGDGGRPLSTGQRRRIGLARVFLRDAPLVVLDEPTADLDAVSAGIVARAIDELRLDRTVLLVTHSTALAARADRVLVLEGGRVAELLREVA